MGRFVLTIKNKRKGKVMKELKKTITGANLWVNGLGWLTLGFSFQENGGFDEIPGDDWTITHLNEGYNYEILDWILGNNDCSLNSFKGKTIILKGERAIDDRQNGIVSFDDGNTWYDINKKKAELEEKWHKYHK